MRTLQDVRLFFTVGESIDAASRAVGGHYILVAGSIVSLQEMKAGQPLFRWSALASG